MRFSPWLRVNLTHSSLLTNPIKEDDAKLFIPDNIYKHLEKPKSHTRLLFADFSSAFNKMLPHRGAILICPTTF